MAEQGAEVVGLDIMPEFVREARELVDRMGLSCRFEELNAVDMADANVEPDWIIFWAALEHMTTGERLASLRAAWDLLSPGGLLTLVETPNRLWPYDSHTSQLPFYSWLPHELAYRYSSFSPRVGFGDRYLDDDGADMDHFLRRGSGVSFHEFEVAIGDHRDLDVVSCMQLHQRGSLRSLAWALSRAGRTERALRAFSPKTHRAWFQPFLYLTIQKA